MGPGSKKVLRHASTKGGQALLDERRADLATYNAAQSGSRNLQTPGDLRKTPDAVFGQPQGNEVLDNGPTRNMIAETVFVRPKEGTGAGKKWRDLPHFGVVLWLIEISVRLGVPLIAYIHLTFARFGVCLSGWRRLSDEATIASFWNPNPCRQHVKRNLEKILSPCPGRKKTAPDQDPFGLSQAR
jgi:hypothetical protein